MEDQTELLPTPPVRQPPPDKAPPKGFNYVFQNGDWILEPNPVYGAVSGT